MRVQVKKGIALFLSAAMILQNSTTVSFGATGDSPRVPVPGLYLNDREVQEGDTVGENAVFQWKTEISFSDDVEEVEVPEGLSFFSKARSGVFATLEGVDGVKRAEVELSDDETIIIVKNPEAKADAEMPALPGDAPVTGGGGAADSAPDIQETQAEETPSAPEEEREETTEATEAEETSEAAEEESQETEAPKETGSETEHETEGETDAPESPIASITPRSRRLVTATGTATNTNAEKEEDEWAGDYILTVPCVLNMEQVEDDGEILVNGFRLKVARSGEELPGFTADIYKLAEDGTQGAAIAATDKVSLKDNLYFVLKRSGALGESPEITAGVSYTITLPKGLKTVAEGTQEVTVSIEGKSVKFADMTWEKDVAVLSITFIEFGPITVDGFSISLGDLNDVNIGFSCGLDKDEIVADESGKVAISLPGGKTVSFLVTELIPAPPALDKRAGALSADGTVSWTITYKQPVKAYKGERPVILKDTLPAGMELVDGTVNVEIDPPAGGTVPVPTAEKGALYFDIANLADGAVLTITYSTKITADKQSEIWAEPDASYVFTNKIEGLNKESASITPSLSASAERTVPEDWGGRHILAKTGQVIGAGDARSVQWTVTVTTASRSFKTLQVTDTMGKGLILAEESVTVNNQTPDAGMKTVTKDSTTGKTTMIIKLVENGNPPAVQSSYTISYKTAIDAAYFNQTGQNFTDEDVSNQAELFYEWPEGVGTGTPPMPPVISKAPGAVGFDSALIKKSAGTYDSENHTITWDVTVNPNKVDLQTVYITDVLTTPSGKGFSHTFVPGKTDGEKTAAEAAVKTAVKAGLAAARMQETLLTSVDITSTAANPAAYDSLDIRLGAIGKNSFKFTLTSYVDDSSFWAANASDTFKNTVTMKKDGTSVLINGTPTPISKDMSASADIKSTSTVLEKTHTGYDPATKTLTWKLTVNKNETDLGTTTIMDTLPAGMSCTAEAIKTANGSLFDGTTGNTVTVTPENGVSKITIVLNQVKAKQEINLPATVDVDDEVLRAMKTMEFTNTASLTSTVYEGPVTISSKASLDNTVLSKTETHTTKIASYTVKLNPLGVDLLKELSGGRKLYLEDTLPDGLYLDLDSVKLYKADRETPTSQSSKYTVNLTKTEPALTLADDALAYDLAKNTFFVQIPDASESYILTYDTHIVRSGVTLSNQIGLVGSVVSGAGENNSANSSFMLNSFGNGKFSLPKDKFFSIQLKKVDGNNNMLKGAKFGLYSAMDDGKLLVSATCDDSTGICTLAVPKKNLTEGQTLYWKEIIAPAGYGINDQWNEIRVGQESEEPVSFTNLRSDEAITGQITIHKVDAADTTLSLKGAVFQLYTDKVGITPAGQPAATDENGTVTFTGLYPNRTYWLKEVTAPDGYELAKELQPAKAVTAANTAVVEVTNQKTIATEQPDTDIPDTPDTDVPDGSSPGTDGSGSDGSGFGGSGFGGSGTTGKGALLNSSVTGPGADIPAVPPAAEPQTGTAADRTEIPADPAVHLLDGMIPAAGQNRKSLPKTGQTASMALKVFMLSFGLLLMMGIYCLQLLHRAKKKNHR